jgi:ribosomal protein S1
MEELLAVTGYSLKGFKRGSTVKGKVSQVIGRTVLVDVGGKMEAIISESEYETAREYLRSLKVGDEVTGFVVSPESDAGQMVLSLRRAAAENKWRAFEESMDGGVVLTGHGKGVNKGGLLVEVEGVVGFVPASQLSKSVVDNPEKLVNKAVAVKIIEVDREQNRLVLSEKAVTESAEIEERRKALSVVETDGVYKGKVVGVVPFGVFVEIEVGKKGDKQKLEGLVHISEISWEKVDNVNKSIKEGQEVEVQVIGTDEENGKLALSMKRLSTDPWKEMADKYPVDSKHAGKVVKVMPYGIFVNLNKGIEGLIHASKIPADMSFKEGEEVSVFVESVDMDKRRLSLGVVLMAKPVGYK